MAQRILVVDDHEDNLRIFGAILRHSGFEVLEASDGEEAVALARSEPLSLILLDLMMPGMDGWQVAELLAADGCMERMPVVALSAHDERDMSGRAREAGFCAYASKPIEPRALLRAVRHCLEQWSAGVRWISLSRLSA